MRTSGFKYGGFRESRVLKFEFCLKYERNRKLLERENGKRLEKEEVQDF